MNKSRKYGLHPATLFLVSTWLVVLISWISDIYEVYVFQPDTEKVVHIQNLLSPEGLRWWMRSMVDNFTRFARPGEVVVASFGLGISLHAFKGYRLQSHKKRRALITALLVAAIYATLVMCGIFPSWGILRGVNGEIIHSPFMESLLFLCSLGIGLTGVVYGFASDRYRKERDVLEGLVFLMPFLGTYFVISFFASQLFACIEYTQLDQFMALWLGNISIPWQLFYWLPIILAYFQYQRQRSFKVAK